MRCRMLGKGPGEWVRRGGENGGHTASRVLANGASACLDNGALQPCAPGDSPITQFLTTIPRSRSRRRRRPPLPLRRPWPHIPRRRLVRESSPTLSHPRRPQLSILLTTSFSPFSKHASVQTSPTLALAPPTSWSSTRTKHSVMSLTRARRSTRSGVTRTRIFLCQAVPRLHSPMSLTLRRRSICL